MNLNLIPDLPCCRWRFKQRSKITACFSIFEALLQWVGNPAAEFKSRSPLFSRGCYYKT